MSPRPLGSVEQAMAETDRAFGLVAVAVVRLRRGPHPEALRRALDGLQARRPLLRARLAHDGRTWRFEPLDPAPPLPLDVVDRRGEGHALAVAERMLGTPFPVGHPLLRAAFLIGDDPDGPADLVLAFHHAVMDAPSAARCCHELLAACAQPGAPASAGPWVPPPPADTAFPAALRGARGLLPLVPFVAREVAADLRYRRRTAPEHRPQPCPDGPTLVRSATLSADATRALAARARRERATLSGALTAALLLAVARRRYPPDTPLLRVIAFADLRPYLDPPPGPGRLGCHIALQRLTLAPGNGVWAVAREASEALAEANRRGGRFLAARMAPHVVRRSLGRPHERAGSVALSYLGPVALDPAYGETEVTGVHAFVSTNRLSPEWSALAHRFRGRLGIDVVHLGSDVDRAEARVLLGETLALLGAPDAALLSPACP